MSERLIGGNPLSGSREYFTYEPITDSVVIKTVEDVSPALSANQALRQLQTGNWRGDMHLVASIPLGIADDLIRRGILYDQKKMRKWLNDRDNSMMRVKEGRL